MKAIDFMKVRESNVRVTRRGVVVCKRYEIPLDSCDTPVRAFMTYTGGGNARCRSGACSGGGLRPAPSGINALSWGWLPPVLVF